MGKQIELVWSEEQLCWRAKEPVTILSTGRIVEFYRFTDNLVVKEKHLIGFAKQFVDSTEIHTIQGLRLVKLYRIRNHEIVGARSTFDIIEDRLYDICESNSAVDFVKSTVEEMFSRNQVNCYNKLKTWLETH